MYIQPHTHCTPKNACPEHALGNANAKTEQTLVWRQYHIIL